MKTKRESEAEVLARRAPAPAMDEAREGERVAAEGATARRKKLPSGKYAAGINKPGSKKQVHHSSFKAPPSEPQQDLRAPVMAPETKITFVRSIPPWEMLGLLAPKPEAEITPVRSNKPKPFSIRAFALGSRRIFDPADIFTRPKHIKPVPEELRDTASSSQLWISNRMLKMPAVPTTAPTSCTSDVGMGFTGDNFTGVDAA